MAADTSIYNALLQRPKSALEWQDAYAAQDDARQVRQLNALNLQSTQEKVAADAQSRSRQNMLYGDLSAAGPNAKPEQLAGIYQRYGDVTSADKVLSSASAREKSGIDAKAAQFDLTGKKLARSKDMLRTMVNDPQSAAHWVRAQYEDPEIGQIMRQHGPVEEALAKIPQDPAAFAQWRAAGALGIDKVASELKTQTNNVGGATVTQVFNPFTQGLSEVGRVTNTLSPNDASQVVNRELVIGPDGQPRVNQPYVDAKARVANAGANVTYGSPIPVVLKDGSTVLVQPPNRAGAAPSVLKVDGNAVSPVGKPGDTTGATKTADAKDALLLIADAEKVIKEATGSFAGSAVDMAGRTVGYSTKGAQNAAKLQALEGLLVSKMPKMSGPQSDKDVALYRQMAGQIGDPTIPYQTKKAALEAIKSIQDRYAGNPAGTSAPAPAAPGGWSITRVD